MGVDSLTSLRDKSIRKKLWVIVMSSVVFAVLLTGSASLLITRQTHQRIAIDSISTLGQVIAENCVIPLTFSIPDDAASVLSTLKTRKTIIAAYLYDGHEKLYAQYNRDRQPSSMPKAPVVAGATLSDGILQIAVPVHFKDQLIGMLSIHNDLSEMDQSARRVSIVLLSVMVVALGVAYLIAIRLQKLIVRPAIELARIAQVISTEKSYSIRAQKYGEDELGQLTDAFNTMLQQIQERDASLRESGARQRVITDHAPEAIVIFDADINQFVYANENAVQLFGWPQEKLLQMTPDELSIAFQPDGRSSKQAAQEYIMSALQGKNSIFEWTHIHADNREISCEVRLVRLPQSGRNLVRESITDITERKQAELELRRLRNYLKNIVDSMPSVLVGVDTKGKVTEWNREAERVTGIGAEHVKGCNVTAVYPQIKVDMARISKAIAERCPLVDQKVSFQRNSETRYNDITVFPLVANGVEGAVVRVDDITDRVRIEEMMIQSEKLASLGGLAAGMAHELNNPLAGITQNLQVIKNRISTTLPGNISAAQQCGVSMEDIEAYMQERGLFELIASVMESARRAARIINNMLAFSRKSSGHKEVSDVSQLLDKAVELSASDYDLRKNYDFRNIEIVREYDLIPPQVSCDPGQIQQVFLNILKNGAQAMAVTIGGDSSNRFLLRIFTEDPWIRIEIEDNGPGMDEATCKRVFEPFFTTKAVGIGTGLGLSVSYFIITENHNGKMAIESVPGRGTRFIIKLPK